jgi:hypothetical protein
MWGKWTRVVSPVVLAGLVACGPSEEAPGDSTRAGAGAEEPAHDVEYEVSTSAAGGELVDVRFTGPAGDQLDARMNGGPTWTQRVRTKPGTTVVSLSATDESAAGRRYDITCRITVDDRPVVETTSLLACADQFSFSRLKTLGTPTPTPATVPPGCDIVSPDDIRAVLGGTTAMSGRVESSTTDGPRCTHNLALGTGSVSYFVDPVGKVGGPSTTKVKALKERAAFEKTVKGGELKVALPDGDVFVLQLLVLRGGVDAQEVATQLYRKARSRLLKNR